MMKYLIFSFLLLLSSTLSGQANDVDHWVDSVLQTLSVEEKIGQIFMVRGFSKGDYAHEKELKKLIDKYHVGGICFFQGDPAHQKRLTEDFQQRSELPLFVAIDAEWGLGMRFPKKVESFPRQMTLGAVDQYQLIYQLGKQIGQQCQAIGANINFAPVVDVNNNPNNPVIGNRSFGESRKEVANRAYAYMRGLETVGVMSCAKHFPGHGDTDKDSHYELPVINHEISRLDSIELYPFKRLIAQGVPAIMVAHLQIPALDNRPKRPTTLSKAVVTDLLRDELGFEGLIFTDGMEMHAVAKNYPPGEADVEAFLAGNDIILLPADFYQAHTRITEAYRQGRITPARLDASVRRILKEKYRLVHFAPQPTAEGDLLESLNSDASHNLRHDIYEHALTLVENGDSIFPIRDVLAHRYATIALGTSSVNVFQNRMNAYADCRHFQIPKNAPAKQYESVRKAVQTSDVVFVSIHDMSRWASKQFGLTEEQIDFVNGLARHQKVVLCLMGSPYALVHFKGVRNVLVAYEDNDLTQEVLAQAIFGVTPILGKLPVSVTSRWTKGTGVEVPGLKRMGFSKPERVGMSSDTLHLIHELMQEMIKDKAAPGAQIVIAKDNRVVFRESFGYHTYQKKRKVTNDDIYDLASLTKVLSSTLTLMQLQGEGRFDLDKQVRDYIPQCDTTNKGDMRYRDVLAHHARLKPWIPFYRYTLSDHTFPRPDTQYYANSYSSTFSIPVADNLFMREDYVDSIYHAIWQSELNDKAEYRYSDLGFYIAALTIQNITGWQLDRYVASQFYKPLGLRTIGYNPLLRFPKDRIPPTEQDDYYRMDLVQGTVHDMGAAMLGGVSGHAGLFSNAMDVAVIMQMLLNKGYYGGYNYLWPNVVEEYTTRYDGSTRRGLGFDMKQLDEDQTLNMSPYASASTFGHLGFTGTCAWADPEQDIVYVMLTNRTYPTMENNKFGRDNYRPKVMDLVYRSLKNNTVQENIVLNP